MSLARNTLAAIHIAKKELALDDDTYRDVLQRVAKVRSAGDLDDRGARLVMAEFERLGFEGRSKKSHRPIVAKARAQWIALHNLDEIDNPHDRALDAFGKSITGKEALSLSDNAEVGKVVEALKSWLARVGVKPSKQPMLQLVLEQRRRLGLHIDGDTLRTESSDRLQAHATVQGEPIRRMKLGIRHIPSPSQGE